MKYNFKNKLVKFFSSIIPHKVADIAFLDELRKFNFHTIAPFLISGLDLEASEETKAKTAIYQAVVINKLKSEFIQLNKAFTDRNLKVISFKGFAISSDVYLEQPRIFTDNDFLCKEIDIPMVLTLLDTLGYKYKAEQNYISPVKIKIPVEKEWFHIGFTHNLKNSSLPAEIHNRLITKSMGINFDIEKIFERAKNTLIFSQKAMVMDIHDRIIFLILHFLKDYRYQINWVIQGDMKHYVDIRKLYDIVLLLDKYRADFRWEVFMERVEILDIVFETKYTFRFIDVIFSELIPKKFLKELNSLPYNTNRLMCEYLEDLINYDVKRLMVFDIEDELRSILKKDNIRPKLYSNNQEFMNMKNRTEKETVITNDIPLIEIYDTKIKLNRNDDYLFIYLKYTGIGNIPQLRFKLINPEQKEIVDVIMNYTVNFRGEDEGILVVYDYVTPIKSETDIIYKHNTQKTITEIEIGLPWHCLNINIDTKQVIFNAMISNINPGVSATNYILFGKNWDSVKNCGYLVLN